MKATKLSKEQFIQKAKDVHSNKYDYSKVEPFKSKKQKVTIICPEHGEFLQIIESHLYGYGCKMCSNQSIAFNRRLTTEKFTQRAKEVHGQTYDYSPTEYKNSSTKVIITCPIHGDFEQYPYDHMNGSGCPTCNTETQTRNQTNTVNEFIKKANQVHGGRYDYSKVEYIHSKTKVDIACNIHGIFGMRPNDHINGHGCPECSYDYSSSAAETEIHDFIKELTQGSVVRSDRSIITPYELDIVIPEKMIAIEYNGLYWHSEQYKDKNYHMDKTNKAKEQGYQLIHIFEDEWRDNKPLIKEKLNHCLGQNKIKVYARKCYLDIPSKMEKSEFYKINHIQGGVGSNIDIGLYFEGEMVACLSLKDKGEGKFDLVRYASSIHVVGGFSKLLNHFKNNYKWNYIYTFADKRWSNGNLYLINGFTHVYDTKPNYWYINKGNRESRIKYQKHKLPNILESFDSNLTEVQNCINNGLYRIFDCGHLKFEMFNQ